MAMIDSPDLNRPGWFKQISRYQWLVLLACYAGGMFDGLDSSLFTISLKPAVSELMQTQSTALISEKGAFIGLAFLFGWTAGGLIFGMLGDRLGRVKALTLSILIYAVFTGLCGFAQTWWQLALFRFMTALGIGGELIVGTTLLAESWPERYRAKAVGVLTTAYQAGVSLVGVASLALGQLSWRYLFFLGALPAVAVWFIRRHVDEPERWIKVDEKRRSLSAGDSAEGSSNFFQIFNRQHLRSTLVASAFTGALLIAYWASTFWIPTWVHQLLPDKNPVQEKSMLLLLQGVFAIAGSTVAGFMADQIGRRWTLFIANLGYLLTSVGMFMLTSTFTPALYAWSSVMGIFIGMNIGICYIYVPELFPTRLRATGTGFCFNMGRIFAALGVVYSSQLIQLFSGSYARAAMSVSFILIIGMMVSFLAPETKGRALQD